MLQYITNCEACFVPNIDVVEYYLTAFLSENERLKSLIVNSGTHSTIQIIS